MENDKLIIKRDEKGRFLSGSDGYSFPVFNKVNKVPKSFFGTLYKMFLNEQGADMILKKFEKLPPEKFFYYYNLMLVHFHRSRLGKPSKFELEIIQPPENPEENC